MKPQRFTMWYHRGVVYCRSSNLERRQASELARQISGRRGVNSASQRYKDGYRLIIVMLPRGVQGSKTNLKRVIEEIAAELLDIGQPMYAVQQDKELVEVSLDELVTQACA